ncbi:MAG: TonB family protein [Calditrichaeota bacterium]|nr:MAG: TonB family protein [Calditrichota bacterium]
MNQQIDNQKSAIESFQKEGKIALITTVFVHIVLLVVFMFLNMGWHYEPSEWIEMDFIAVKSKPARQRSQARPAPSNKAPEIKKQPKRQFNINLPKRKILEEDESLIQKQRRDIVTQDEFSTPVRSTNVQKQEVDPLQQLDSGSQKQAADLGDIQAGDKNLKFEEQDFGRGVTIPFKIEGEVSDRSVLHKVIPQYPSGLRNEAVVKLRFSVLPSGVVVNIVPVHKGSAELEKAAIAAFQQWRFNALSTQNPQNNQGGMITFRFVLR